MTAPATPTSADPWAAVELGTCAGIPVAIGGDLTPQTLLGAYCRGIFCQPRSDRAGITENQLTYEPDVDAGHIPVLPGPGNPCAIPWWSPSPRYAIPVRDLRIGRTLRKRIRRAGWTTTVNTAFEAVIAHCRAGREPHWITDDLVDALRALHTSGWVRSIEVWHREELVGGLYGCAMDTVFTMDSAFHTMDGAAKAAIANLAGRASVGNIQLLDAQVRTDYTSGAPGAAGIMPDAAQAVPAPPVQRARYTGPAGPRAAPSRRATRSRLIAALPNAITGSSNHHDQPGQP